MLRTSAGFEVSATALMNDRLALGFAVGAVQRDAIIPPPAARVASSFGRGRIGSRWREAPRI